MSKRLNLLTPIVFGVVKPLSIQQGKKLKDHTSIYTCMKSIGMGFLFAEIASIPLVITFNPTTEETKLHRC
jgi:hypothetical protein